MESHQDQPEKVYVAIGSDIADAFGALRWALKKWSSQLITIVILHAANDICKDYVYTPLGKLPAASLCEEKLRDLEKSEEAKTDKMLAKFIAYCGEVKAEVLKIDKQDKPFQEVILELISSLRISKLVMALTFMRLSTWKSRSAISGSYYVHRRKPDYCELFITCSGKLVYLKGEGDNDGYLEDEQGSTIAKVKERNSFKGWLGKMLSSDRGVNERIPSSSSPSSSSSASDKSPLNKWGRYHEEIEQYFNQLLSTNAEVGDNGAADVILQQRDPAESDMLENMGTKEKNEALRTKISRTREVIELNQKQVKVTIERQRKAEWAISLCTSRVEELDASTKDETAKRASLQKELDSQKEELCELQSEVEEKRSKLNSILELQRELSNKLQLSSLEKSRAEIQLEKSVRSRAEMVSEIEELRRQRDVLQRRIEFCREKDAIGNANKKSNITFDYRKFTASEIRAATKDLSASLRFKSGGLWTNVYKGRINHITVAIKLYDPSEAPTLEDLLSKVKLLGNVRHPHLLGVIGFCPELYCIVFEYMHNGCLRDKLFSNLKSSRNQGLTWHDRIRITVEICSALAFLHQVQPRPIVHGNLDPSKILLDRHNVAKVHGYKATACYDELDMQLDIHAFGNLTLQMLTGRNWAAIDNDAIRMDTAAIIGFLDDLAGEWPSDLAIQLCNIAVRCLSNNITKEHDLHMNSLMKSVDKIRQKADKLAEKGKQAEIIDENRCMADPGDVPSIFFCPIYQDIMKDPYVAADGFSYELEAIENWLARGRDTSPMTNLKLKHKLLTPNHTLRCLIEDWRNKRSIPTG